MPARTGLAGRIVWNRKAVPNFRVEVREWTIPGPGILYGAATTNDDGRFVVTGLPVKGDLELHLAAQSGYTFSGYGRFTTCGDRITELGDHLVTRAIVGLSVAQGGFAPSGVNVLTWAAVPAATSYCVVLFGITSGRTLTGGHCEPVGSSGSLVTTSAFVTPPLISGDMYAIMIAAFANDIHVGSLADGNVNFTAR